MSVDVFYTGPSGLIKCSAVVCSNKAISSAGSLIPKDQEHWNAGGMAINVELLQIDRTLSESESSTLFHGFMSGTGVVTLPSITQDGIVYHFVTDSVGILRLDPNASNNIVYSNGAMSNGEYLQIENSSNISIMSSSSSWISFRENGTFTEETP